MISRRGFMGALAGSLLSVPLTAEAQPSGTGHRIGFLGGGSASGYAILVEALRLGLRDRGYVEGKNITIEYRWADGKYDRLPVLAAELVRLKVGVIVTQGTPAALAAKQATQTIPIVMAIVGNPVETGIWRATRDPGGTSPAYPSSGPSSMRNGWSS